MNANPYQSPDEPSEISDHSAVPLSEELWEIRKQAQTALLAGYMGIFIGFVFAPIAIICGNQALKSIARKGIGQEFEPKARLGIVLGKVMVWFWSIMIVVFSVGVLVLHFAYGE